MKHHLKSILRSPVGYAANFLATVTCYVPVPSFVECGIARLCEEFCIADGVQNDPLF